MREFLNRLKFVKGKDILAVFPMLIGIPCGLFKRITHTHIWLVCERENEARDNGYWFFKYLIENHPEIEAVYAIKKSGIDFEKVNRLGKTIEFGSLKHWIYYFAAERNISSQKEGKPNAALCFVLEVYLGFRKNRVYIRHGICKDDQKWVYYDVTKMNVFVCSAIREYEFVKERFGYPEENVQLLGLCRFDNLHKVHKIKRQIVVMPTMREWLRNVSTDTLKYEGTDKIEESEYFVTWNSFIHNVSLAELLEQYDIDLVFFPHSSLHKYLNLFRTECNRIHIGDARRYDVQQLLMESSVLITDYSSIYFDFGYMKKPLLYYQFDYKKYRLGQYQEGYYSYENDGFGKIVANEKDLINELKKILDNGCIMENFYKNRVDEFFAFKDEKNCERTYHAVKQMR